MPTLNLDIVEMYTGKRAAEFIEFAWVRAKSFDDARMLVAMYVPEFQVVITIDESVRPRRLALGDDSVFGICLTDEDLACDMNPCVRLR